MNHPARFSEAEQQHGGEPCFVQTVSITAQNGQEETVRVLAADNVDAMNKAFELLYPWDSKRPRNGLVIAVIPTNGGAA